MFGSTVPASLNAKPSYLCVFHGVSINAHLEFLRVGANEPRSGRRRRRRTQVFQCLSASHHQFHQSLNGPKLLFSRKVLTKVTNDDSGGSVDATSQKPSSSDIREANSSSNLGDSYVSLFVRMLGLDNDPLDRDQAIVALWKYSLGGKKFVDAIMQFPGCINLTINLLRSESSSTCEAAAGLLRSISMFNPYKDLVVESGAIEEITGLLNRPSLMPMVKEQSLCVLWNLSVDEKLRVKIANVDILPILVKSLDDDDVKVKEAAGGILSNLALSQVNHKIMVDEGVIPKLAKFLKNNDEGSKVMRKEARNTLLELSKDQYYKILIIEEGLVPVPLIGAEAYKSLEPGLRSWPSLPDGSEIERSSEKPSRFGASELLLGLNVDEKKVNIDEAKMNAIVGRTQQQFLARIGAIEIEDGRKEPELSSSQRLTLLPWVDGVARLVLILDLKDDVAISRAAEAIADASINEEMRIAFREAGAVKHLIRLLGYNNQAFKLPVIRALERLSISNRVCQVIEADVIDPLIETLRYPDISQDMKEKTLDILARILDPSKEMGSKFYDLAVNGSDKGKDEDLSEEHKQKANTRTSAVDSAAISCLFEILKSSPPNLQWKAASILEFIASTEPIMDMVNSVKVESSLDAVFRQKVLADTTSNLEAKEPEKYALEVEEAGLAVSAASRLLTKLLDSDKFYRSIDSRHLTKLLREVLKSSIPLRCKDWVAACLVKLGSLSPPNRSLEDSIITEVTLYETIPRLIEQLKGSSSLQVKEAVASELNRIVSEGLVDSNRAVASEGGISHLVKLIEEGSEIGVEAGLAILYNLSMESENHAEIVAAGAVPVLKRIVLSQRPQWTKALHLLRTLPT